MSDLMTDPKVLLRLEEAARRALTAAQVHRQKVSFIMGSLGDDSTITRSKVEEVLRRLEGSAA
jgi:molecular chaperone DnaK (HSP70)